MKSGHYIFIVCIFACWINTYALQASSPKVLTLSRAIKLAADSSLASIKAKNVYLSGYWQFRTFKAGRLPSLKLATTPLEYDRSFVKRYDSENDIDVYKTQQTLYSSANLTLSQNVDITGGTLYVETELDYLRNIGVNVSEQYSSVPFSVGYSQSLFGYNSFKWDKRIEPVHYEKVKKELLLNIEEISEQVTEYFFSLALYRKIYDLACQNVANSDSMYQIGSERYKIGSISNSDLLTLRLDVVNTKIAIKEAEANLKESSFNLASYLQMDPQTQFDLILPTQPLDISISVEEALRWARENNPTIPELKENNLTAQQTLDQTKKGNRFSASVSANVGFNQVAYNFMDAYRKPLQQDVLSVSLSVPLLDWGVGKGKVNMAKKNLTAVNITSKQAELSFEQDVLMAVNNFNNRQSQLSLQQEAKEIAAQANEKAKQLFMVGKTDVNTVNSALSRQIEAESSYITALKNYWIGYYKIRELTLFDFEKKRPISVEY